METEIWPHLFGKCKSKNIPLLLANARLSEKSAKGYEKLGSLTREMLSAITILASQGKKDAERFIALGMPPDKVKVVGNLKFDLELAPDLIQKSENLREELGKNRLIWIAGSTHPGEEEFVLAAHHLIRKQFPNALLILVPRHPERFESVALQCKAQGFKTSRRSLKEACTEDTAVYLSDTMGEMMLCYAVADVAYVGGSLVPVGGHNMLEPAALDKPSISGPNLFNFAEISQMLLSANGMLVIQDADTLAAAVIHFFENPDYRHQVGQNAKKIVLENRGALQRHVDLIKQYTSS